MKYKITSFAILAVSVFMTNKAMSQPAKYTSTLNAAGGTKNISGNNYEWSVGEMALVKTSTGSNIIVTQGVLQPVAQSGGHVGDVTTNSKVSVYPVPSKGIVNLQSAFGTAGTLHYELMDVTGKSLVKRTISINAGTQKQTLDLQMYANGSYMLQVDFTDKNNAQSRNSFKLEKIN